VTVYSYENTERSFDEPEGGDATDCIGGRRLRRGVRGLRIDAEPAESPANKGRARQRGHYRCDEAELSELDADIGEEQRERNGILREADFVEHAGETKAMQQSERERHDPRPTLGQSRPALVTMDDLAGHEHNRECDDRLYRLRHASQTPAWPRPG
jgi:hypothetical protein